MQKIKQPLFKLSLLSLSLMTGMVYAEQPVTKLDVITVKGNAVPTIVTDHQLDQRVATDLKQAMKNQVGMTISGGNGVAQYYSIRDIGEDKITLDVDGTTMTSSVLHHQGRFMLDPSLAKVIDVEKGTGSASAGFGALAGVVRVTTVDAKDLLRDGQNVGLKIGANASSNRGIGGNLAAYANQNGFDVLFAGNYLNNGDYKDGRGNKNYGSKLRQHSYLAKIGYDFNENHSVRLSVREEYQIGRRLPTIEFSYDPTAQEKTGESDSAQRQRTFNLEYHGRNLGFINKLDANIFRTVVSDYKPPKAVAANQSTSMELTRNYSSGANLNLSSDIGTHELKYGINYRKESAKSSNKDSWAAVNGNKTPVSAWLAAGNKSKDMKKDEYGLYVEGIWDLNPITFTTGLRYDTFKYQDARGQTVSHGQFNPSLGVIYTATPNLAFIANLNQASRAPRLVETLLASERYMTVQADKNLKAETARRAELGFKWENEGFTLSANIFKQDIKDLITFKHKGFGANADLDQALIYNDGKLKMHGYEVDASYKTGGLTARVALSDAKPKLERTGANPAAEDPYLFWNVGRQWLTSLSYRFENPSLELGWTGRYFESVDYYGGKPAAKSTKAGYAVHDIFVNWQPLGTDVFNINLGVNNLFNKYYVSQSQRGNSGFYERGREFVAGFNYRF